MVDVAPGKGSFADSHGVEGSLVAVDAHETLVIGGHGGVSKAVWAETLSQYIDDECTIRVCFGWESCVLDEGVAGTSGLGTRERAYQDMYWSVEMILLHGVMRNCSCYLAMTGRLWMVMKRAMGTQG